MTDHADSTTPSTNDLFSSIATELSALRAAHAAGQQQIEELRAELALLRNASERDAVSAAAVAEVGVATAGAPTSERGAVSASEPALAAAPASAPREFVVTSRRRLFAIAGGAAAAAVVVGTSASSTPAAAAASGYGSPLTLGDVNTAPAGPAQRTQLNYLASSGSVDNYFLVTDGGAGDGAVLGGSAIGGYAYSNVGTGVYGFSNVANGNGVFGYAFNNAASYGLYGKAQAGVGVAGQSYSGYDFAGYGSGRLYLHPHVGTGPPYAGAHAIGEIVRDSNGDWYVSYQSGTPGKWRKLGGGTTAGALHVLNPTRVYDSRFPGSGGRMAAGTVRVVSVANGIDIFTGATVTPDVVPSEATAIAFNLTIAGSQGSGYLSVTPGSAATFGASSINWDSRTGVLANGTLVQLDSARQVKVFANGGSTDFIIDVTGYYL